MHKRRLLAAVLALVLSAGCVSCGQRGKPPVEITVIHGWGSTESDHVAMRKIYEDFEGENPDVKIRLISMPTRTEMIQKVEDMIMVGEIPDVVSFGGVGRNTTYDFMVDNQLALDLMPYINEDADFRENIADTNLEYWTTADEKLYTVSDVLLLSGGYWYNEDVFRQAGITEIPATWDAYEDVCRRIANWSNANNKGIKPLRASAEGYLYFWDHLLWAGAPDAETSTSEHRVQLNAGRVEETVVRLKRLYGFSTESGENYSYRDETDLFNEGRTAMYINGVWGAAMIDDDINAKYALLPSVDGVKTACESAGLHYVLGNTKDKTREEASVRFLKYMMSEAVQERILKETEQVPANPNISPENYKEDMPRFYQAVSAVREADNRIEAPDNLWSGAQKDAFLNHVVGMLADEISVEDFMEQLQ